jgi:hypothetical protein
MAQTGGEFWKAGRARASGVKAEDVEPEELDRGTEVELEHTTSRRLARRIALDHLAEYEEYYHGLEFVEGLMELGLLVEAMDLVERYLGDEIRRREARG